VDRVTPLLRVLQDVSCSAVERAKAGVALSKLGDRRPGVGLDEDGLPAFVWTEWIPGGTFLMGSADGDQSALENELPQHSVGFGSFRISVYPVTNAQFRAFTEAADGWSLDRWWTAQGLAWRQSATVWCQGDSPDNFPCVQVSWHAAVAFANWVSGQTKRMSGAKCTIRLPSEPEWERAARGLDGRLYPWGSDFDPNRCNMKDSGIGGLCSVGIFPGGLSVAGAHDMVGGTWEWCASLSLPYPYDAERENLEASGKRVIRGGSFNRDAGGVRCAVRREDPPDHAGGSISFRVVCASAPP
jgi:formylglycine-generating enzyme required for sulfatase activity